MSGLSPYIGRVAAILLALASPVSADDGPRLAPSEGLLVLHSGEVLSGTISRSGDRYYVALDRGELRIPADEVLMVCQTLDEAYRRKRSAFESGDAGQHLELGNWCLKHNLVGYAAAELAEALAANPRHQELASLRRRLHLALEPPREPAAATERAPPSVSADDLDRMTSELPPSVLETFRQSVQPVLLNHCATAGCHGPRSATALKLLRIPPGGTASRQLTQRNLHSVLPLVNRDDARESQLLSMSITPHGESPAAFVDAADPHYGHLRAWIDQWAGGPAPVEQPETVDGEHFALHQNSPAHTVESPPPTDSADPTTAESPAASGRAVPADPFDPEIFNRRYFPPEPNE